MYAFWFAWIWVDMLLLFDIIFSDVVNLSNEAKPSLQCIFKQEMMNKKQYYNICNVYNPTIKVSPSVCSFKIALLVVWHVLLIEAVFFKTIGQQIHCKHCRCFI